MKYPKDKKQLDDFYTEWHEVNKEELKDTWTRSEVYNFASSYAARSFSKFYRSKNKRVLPLNNKTAEQLLDESAKQTMKHWDIEDFKKTHKSLYTTIINAINKGIDK